MPEEVDTKSVIVPVRRDHKGNVVETRMIVLPWYCPECGEPRGEPELVRPRKLLSLPKYKRMPYHKWQNPCGHKEPDTYSKNEG